MINTFSYQTTMRCGIIKLLNYFSNSRKLPIGRLIIRNKHVSPNMFNVHLSERDLNNIENNVALRGSHNNIAIIRKLLKDLERNIENDNIRTKLEFELRKLPNTTHPRLELYGDKPKEIMHFGRKFENTSMEFSDVSKRMNLCRMDHLGNYTGHKSYYLMDSLAMLEQAIITYAIGILVDNGFQLISVPDILPKYIIEGCGMQTEGERAQVYKLDSDMCLSGTSEMALAGFFSNEVIAERVLPIKVAAVSRCYRAETSGLQEERGIYRVHQFTKVEMFSVCTEKQSEEMLDSFKDIEIDIFQKLDLNLRLLDMPPLELGNPAYQKYDIEAWMPGRKMWGEISSCSNCTDYQAKRLNIEYRNKDGVLKFVHTVNGTATAIPRLLIALIETHQVGKNISIPNTLRHLMKTDQLTRNKQSPETKLVKLLKLRN